MAVKWYVVRVDDKRNISITQAADEPMYEAAFQPATCYCDGTDGEDADFAMGFIYGVIDPAEEGIPATPDD